MAGLIAIAAALFVGREGVAAVPRGHAPVVADYRPVFEECRGVGDVSRLAIRRMRLDGTATLLLVDPERLTTSLAAESDWRCADTDDARQGGTRFVRAILAAEDEGGARVAAAASGVIADGGLARGARSAGGSFLTGDLCPSRRPLDRGFLEGLASAASPAPVALSISGTWLTRHLDDFRWLKDQERAGRLRITWVDHSYDHPFARGVPADRNFLLTPGTDMAAEIFDTERLLIAHGATPSVFFRFPGLVSNRALMAMVAARHLIVLGADSWLARTGKAKPGGIILVHLNGNEPAGLKIFASLRANGGIPLPLRPIDEAP